MLENDFGVLSEVVGKRSTRVKGSGDSSFGTLYRVAQRQVSSGEEFAVKVFKSRDVKYRDELAAEARRVQQLPRKTNLSIP